MTKKFLGKTYVEGVEANDLKREFKKAKAINVEVPNSKKIYKSDLVLLDMGFSECEEAIAKNFWSEIR